MSSAEKPQSGIPVQFDPPGRGRIYNSIVETIGNTPLVRVPNLSADQNLVGDLLLKLEFFNPISSVKDRIGVGMILDLEQAGKISPGDTLIEPTSGNTGIGLAFVAASRGYRLILTMPDSMSIERQKMLVYLGAELVLTPKEKGVIGAISKAEELLLEYPGSVMPSQFTNPSNPDIHRKTTAEEIWVDTDKGVDVIIAGVGTGGTITGIGQTLKPRKSDLKIVAVEPELSQVLSGGTHSPHAIQGIGAGIIPKILDLSIIDEFVPVSNEEAIDMSRKAARLDGIPMGISSGAAVAAGVRIAKRPEMKGKMIVAIIPSFAERYLSTVLFDGI
ncbi:MAG: cysteine synthase A [Rhizobiaceae bacterium]|nr:cysteine synthase A [Rhizobiaceae bacterium]